MIGGRVEGWRGWWETRYAGLLFVISHKYWKWIPSVCSSSLWNIRTVFVSLLLALNLVFFKTASRQPGAFIMPPFYRPVSCRGCTPAGSSFSQIRSTVTALYRFYWGREMKTRTRRDGSYFDFYGLTASDVLHWVTLTVLTARSKNRKTKSSCSFKKIVKLWVITELYSWGFFFIAFGENLLQFRCCCYILMNEKG